MDPDPGASGGRKYLPETVAAGSSLVANQTCVRCALSMSSGAPAPPRWGPIPVLESSTSPRETVAPPRMPAAHPETWFRLGLGAVPSPLLPQHVVEMRSGVDRHGVPTPIGEPSY